MSRSIHESESRGLLLAGIAAPVVMAGAILVAGQLEPDYSHATQYVSELGAVGATNATAFNLVGLSLVGLLTILFAIGMYRQVRPSAWLVTSSALVAVAGLGRLAAGFFPCDAGCALEGMSTTATIHAGMGFMALNAGVIAPVALAIGLRHRRPHPLFGSSVGLGVLSVVLAVVFFGLGKELVPNIGIVQRTLLAALYAWIVAIVLNIDTLSPKDSAGRVL